MPRIKTVLVSAKQLKGFTNQATTRQHSFVVDQPPPLGEDGGPTPLELLLLALSNCMISTGYIVARQNNLEVSCIQVEAQGDMDMDFTAGKTTEGRAGFTGIAMRMTIAGNLTDEQKTYVVQETERRCPVRDNLLNATAVSLTIEG